MAHPFHCRSRRHACRSQHGAIGFAQPMKINAAASDTDAQFCPIQGNAQVRSACPIRRIRSIGSRSISRRPVQGRETGSISAHACRPAGERRRCLSRSHRARSSPGSFGRNFEGSRQDRAVRPRELVLKSRILQEEASTGEIQRPGSAGARERGKARPGSLRRFGQPAAACNAGYFFVAHTRTAHPK